MTDQQRADFFASEGFSLDTMPFIDDLGRRGVRFSRAYTPNPTCAPARCSMLTGRYPKATRVRENGGIKNIFRPRDMIETLRDRNYSIYLAGKNHTYLRPESFDGFSEYHHTGSCNVEPGSEEHVFDSYLASLDHGVAGVASPQGLEAQLPHRIVQDALRFVDRHPHDRPFFLWLSFPEPHNPYQVCEPYYSIFPESKIPAPSTTASDGARKGGTWRWLQRLLGEKRPGFENDWRRYRANYCGMIRLIDDQIRRFYQALGELDQIENTLFIFTSDHGDYAGDYGLQRKGVGLPECLIRIPMLVTGPGIVPRQCPVESFVSLVDLFPTICEMLGAPIPYGVQGKSLWPILTGISTNVDLHRSAYSEVGYGGEFYGENERPPLHFPYEGRSFDELNSVTQSGRLKMVRKGDWKLIFSQDDEAEMYHITEDPMERENLWLQPGNWEVKNDLLKELLTWNIRTEDDLPTGRYCPKSYSSTES